MTKAEFLEKLQDIFERDDEITEDMVLEDMDEWDSLSAMADEMNITLSYLSTIFKQSSGRNLNNYVAEKRLELSKKMLQSPSYSIKEIAVSCGYENIGYFSTIFRRKVGMTPSQFRNCHL